MSIKTLVQTYLLVNNMTRKALAKKAGVDVNTLRNFMNGNDILNQSFKKIVQSVDYEIHLKPKK